MTAPTIILAEPDTRAKAIVWARRAPCGTLLTFQPPRKHSPAQSAKLHATLTEIAATVTWHDRQLTVGDWKDVFIAALRSAHGQLDTVPGLDGGLVMLGLHTAELTGAEMSELIDMAVTFAGAHTEPHPDA